MTSYSDKLKAFYSRKHISFAGFSCPLSSDCYSSVPGKPISKGAEAYVGRNYGEVTKILVVSLDIGGEAEDLDSRRKTIEKGEYKNPHMKGTYLLLQELLKQQIGNDNPFLYCSMINSSKCAINDGMANMAPKNFFINCKPYTIQEISTLEPNLIVVQGAIAKRILATKPLDDTAIQNAIRSLGIHNNTVFKWIIPLIQEYVYKVDILGIDILALCVPHPSARDGRWQKFVRTSLKPICDIIWEI